ncbi:ecdysone oxidase-like isoform X2 [Anticarsia gemmatalis]|uniref:ecdysone oxidase-like isoform X2 n=1 Tax=Anticarsia gemmatalis TaxID=129554 RepID=UPI003F767EB7
MNGTNSSSTVAYFLGLQSILRSLQVLDLGGYQWPKPACVKNDDEFDFIIVGAGTAGCVIANRLIETKKANVLLIEAGGNPPYETELAGLLPFMKKTRVDWNFTSACDIYSPETHKNNVIDLTQGKMIGGSAALGYAVYAKGNEYDFNRWAKVTKDSTWSWKEVLPTFLKNEQLIDNRILNSPDKCFYGTKGNIKIMKQYFKRNEAYFAGFRELGWKTPLDINPNNPLGFTNFMVNIGDERRQTTALKFLSPIKDNRRLRVMVNTLATKVIFDDNKRAIGVEVITSDNKVITVKAKIEVIVSAGAIKSPQLLMLSGIGPKHHLESKGIKVIADLPVGRYFHDHVNSNLVYKLKNSTRGAQLKDPHKYPYSVFDGYMAVNISQDHPDYQTVGVSFGEQITFLGICTYLFNYSPVICDYLSKSMVKSELLMVILTLLYPKSLGKILLVNKDPLEKPIILPNYYAKDEDVIKHADCLENFNQVLETESFKTLGAELIVPELKKCQGLRKFSKNYWRCYVVGFYDTAHYFTGTCKMETVGTTTQATVIMVAQKGAEFIIKKYFS